MPVGRVAVAGRINGVDEWRNVFTIEQATGTFDTDAITDYLDALYTSSVLSQLSNRITWERWILETPDGLGHWVYNRERAYSLVGSSSGDMLPNQMAVVIIGITQSRRRGKKFVPGLVEASTNNGRLDSGGIAIWTTFAQNYTDPSAGVPGIPFVAGVCKPTGTDFLQFDSFRVDPLLGTQRRRKPGVGA